MNETTAYTCIVQCAKKALCYSGLMEYPARLMNLDCNLPNRPVKFLTNITGNLNCIITVLYEMNFWGASEIDFWAGTFEL